MGTERESMALESASEKAMETPPDYKGDDTYSIMLDRSMEFLMNQTTKGWFQELCGCDANTQFKFYVSDAGANGQYTHTAMIEEQSSCCMRFCCRSNREWITKMVETTDANADLAHMPAMLEFERPFRCPKGPCKCCCFQEVMVRDGSGNFIGGIKEQSWCCVPHFTIYSDEAYTPQYDLHQPTCCGGACVDCCAQGCCNCRVPFYIYNPGATTDDKALPASKCRPVEGMETEIPSAQICKLWSGMAKELFTDADNFELKCPDGADGRAKARLIASTLLINQVFFEKDEEEDEVGTL